jgi:hypothetical protein
MSPSSGASPKGELALELPQMPALTPTLANALLAAIKNSLPEEEPSADALAGSCHPSVIAS